MGSLQCLCIASHISILLKCCSVLVVSQTAVSKSVVRCCSAVSVEIVVSYWLLMVPLVFVCLVLLCFTAVDVFQLLLFDKSSVLMCTKCYGTKPQLAAGLMATPRCR